ncbi:hypothetical protein SESBI_14746 [Sesbania bispinosa]|nr:hypothetical protein SESBI_14746 [Sesbania bispinosa]
MDMEPKPPDIGSQPSGKASFRDTLLGNKNNGAQREKIDLISNNLFREAKLSVALDKDKPSSEDMEVANSSYTQEDLHVITVDNQNIQGSQNSGQIVFQSKVVPQPNSPNARKKRHRTEPPPKVMKSSGTQSFFSSSKVNSVEAAGTSLQPYGIKTMMNVEVLSSNRLRFRDEDDPGGSPSCKSVIKDQAMDNKDQGMINKPDVGMEASIVPDQ